MKVILCVLAACSLAVFAMVPRERRAMPEPIDEEPSGSDNMTGEVQYCARRTPCAWAVYKPTYKIIELNFTNSYCICAPGLVCVEVEDDHAAFAYIHRCRKPKNETTQPLPS